MWKLILFLSLICIQAQGISFEFNLKKAQTECFSEALEEKLLVVLKVKLDDAFIKNSDHVLDVKIYDHDGVKFYES